MKYFFVTIYVFICFSMALGSDECEIQLISNITNDRYELTLRNDKNTYTTVYNKDYTNIVMPVCPSGNEVKVTEVTKYSEDLGANLDLLAFRCAYNLDGVTHNDIIEVYRFTKSKMMYAASYTVAKQSKNSKKVTLDLKFGCLEAMKMPQTLKESVLKLLKKLF